MKLYYFPGACSLADHIVLEWMYADAGVRAALAAEEGVIDDSERLDSDMEEHLVLLRRSHSSCS